MVSRKIIKINENLCTGCGSCITACAEGAIKLENGKARVVSDKFCDGLGACLIACPEGALTIEERDAEEFDEQAAKDNLKKKGKTAQTIGTPCTAPISLCPEESSATVSSQDSKATMTSSQLSNWPIQMLLVSPTAPFLKGARLLVAADCTGFACPTIHQEFLPGRIVLTGCPKLDEVEPFIDRLAEILKANDIKDITVLHMTVPCCANLSRLVFAALKRSGKDVPVKEQAVGVAGRRQGQNHKKITV